MTEKAKASSKSETAGANHVREQEAARLRALLEEIADHQKQEEFHRRQARELGHRFPELARQALETVLADEGLALCARVNDHVSKRGEGDNSVGIFPAADLRWVYQKEGKEEVLFQLCPQHLDRVYQGTDPATGVTTYHIQVEEEKMITARTERDVTDIPKRQIDYPRQVYEYLGLPLQY